MEESVLDKNALKGMSSDAKDELILNLLENQKELNRQIENLLEQIKIMNSRTYGRKTETSSTIIEMPQLELGLNEAEFLCDAEEAKEPELEEITYKRKKQKGKKEVDLKKITEQKEINVYLTDKELNERYGEGKWKKLPDEHVYKLEHLPESFIAVTYNIGVYAKDDNETIVRADRPAELFPKSIATPSLVSSLITAKYVNAIPFYRLEKAYEANDVFLPRATMARWTIKASEEYLGLVYNAMKQCMVKQTLLHADETPFEVSKDGRPAGSKSYMWVYRANSTSDGPKAILYDYCPTRGHQNPEEFLKNFSGTLVTDGYGAYHELERENPSNFKVAGCWVHAKRKFANVLKANKNSKGSFADKAVKLIQKIYHEEHKIMDLPKQEHLKKRQEIIRPIVEEFFAFIHAKINYIDPQSETGKGFRYALNQEKYLRVFLDDPDVPLDNNAAEIAIRPFTIGRKNWVLIDTPSGAKASAVLYSIVETARANNLKVYPYITYLLTELMNHESIDNLLPWSNQLPNNLYKK